jgi:hypothetical protein
LTPGAAGLTLSAAGRAGTGGNVVRGPGFVERRRHVRFDIDGPVDILVRDGTDPLSFARQDPGRAVNLSAGGICYVAETRVEPGAAVRLGIHLPGRAQPLELEGEVRWCMPSGREEGRETFRTGVQLFTEPKTDEGRLVEYVCERMIECLRSYTDPRFLADADAEHAGQWVLVRAASRAFDVPPAEIKRLIQLGLEARVNPGSTALTPDSPLLAVDTPPVFVNLMDLERELGRRRD